MQKLHTLLLAVIALSASAGAQPNILWTQSYGGAQSDYGFYVQQTADQGFIITGIYNLGSYNQYGDLYLIKTDAAGDIVWTRTYGGVETERGYCVQPTSDGGYVISGIANETMYGLEGDLYVLKTDANGETIWSRIYNFGEIDVGHGVVETTEGGYVVAGMYDGGFPESYGDILLMKFNSDGDSLWLRTYHNRNRDCAYSLAQTDDGGFILSCATNEDPYALYGEIYLMRTNANGDTIWTRNYGEGLAHCVRQTQDGGFIVAGYTHQGGAGEEDIMLMKTDGDGNSLWLQTWGTSWMQMGFSCVETDAGDYILVGDTFLPSPVNNHVAYFIKTDPGGNTIWEYTHVSGNYCLPRCIQRTEEGGYAVTGLTSSPSGSSVDVLLLYFVDEAGSVNVSLAPHNPPIQIPSSGGSFEFDIEITNSSSTAYVVDIALDAILPAGMIYPILLRSEVALGAGVVIERDNLTQFVPGRAPAGDYTYSTSVFDHETGQLLAEDSFPFEKLARIDAPEHGQNWALFGWEEEDIPSSQAPMTFALNRVYPNPFNPTTAIRYQLSAVSFVNLSVYDVYGRKVAELVDGWRETGSHEVAFDGSNLASGIYIYRLEAGHFRASGKMVLVK